MLTLGSLMNVSLQTHLWKIILPWIHYCFSMTGPSISTIHEKTTSLFFESLFSSITAIGNEFLVVMCYEGISLKLTPLLLKFQACFNIRCISNQVGCYCYSSSQVPLSSISFKGNHMQRLWFFARGKWYMDVSNLESKAHIPYQFNGDKHSCTVHLYH